MPYQVPLPLKSSSPMPFVTSSPWHKGSRVPGSRFIPSTCRNQSCPKLSGAPARKPPPPLVYAGTKYLPVACVFLPSLETMCQVICLLDCACYCRLCKQEGPGIARLLPHISGLSGLINCSHPSRPPRLVLVACTTHTLCDRAHGLHDEVS